MRRRITWRLRPTYREERREGAGAAGTDWSLTGRGRGEAGDKETEGQVCWGPSYGRIEYQEVQDWQEDVETHEQSVAAENDQVFKQKSFCLDVNID